jgi:hypothetical protein
LAIPIRYGYKAGSLGIEVDGLLPSSRVGSALPPQFAGNVLMKKR